jgi:serine/threonine-protein kinase RsbT
MTRKILNRVGITTDRSDQRINVARETDIILACQKGRSLAGDLGFDAGDQVAISIAISEVTHNILDHAGSGIVTLRATRHASKEQAGLEVVASDQGPGIADVEMALLDGYTTGKGLGVGLPGARRLMDEIEVESRLGTGTTITMRKWVR